MMNRRSFLSAALAVPSLAALLAACGDDRVSPGDTTGGTNPGTGSTPGNDIVHPTGADDVVLRIATEGGFVAPDSIFVAVPTLLLSGNGRAIEVGAIPEIYPGPLLPPLFERSISEAGVQAVLQAAKAAGLLAAPPDYSMPDGIGIADAPDTVVRIAANGTVYEHRANALGMEQTSTPARDRLSAFVNAMSDLAKVAGADTLGQSAALVPTAYRIRATQVDPTQYTEPAPTLVAWPEAISVRLPEAATCAVIPASEVGSLFADANQLTFFTETDAAYQVAVVQVLPGDKACV